MQFQISFHLDEAQTVYLKPRSYNENNSSDYIVTVTKYQLPEGKIGIVDSQGHIGTNDNFDVPNSTAIVQINCLMGTPMYLSFDLRNKEVNAWIILVLTTVYTS